MKTITLSDFLTPRQINLAKMLYSIHPSPAKLIAEQVIEPNISEINSKLGQVNLPIYLAHGVEHAFNNMGIKKRYKHA